MSSTDKDYGEKRNFIRMFIDAEVTLTDLQSGQKYDGESKDLSGDGVSIITQHEFKMAQKLKIDIRTKLGNQAPLLAEFEVKRVIPMDEGMFEIAGTIQDVS